MRQFPALAFIVAVSLTGCAGGQSTPSASLPPVTSSSSGVAPSPSVASPSPAAASASPATAALVDPRDGGLDVAFGEFAITMEADTIRPGPIVFVIRNAGALTHGFEMRIDADRSGPGGGDDEFKIETDTFRSGDTVRVETDLPPGRYEIECFVADHDDRGMRTFLEVRRDAPLVAPSGVAGTPGSVAIGDFAFQPPSLEVAVGTDVTWRNTDPAPHTVSAPERAFDSGQLDPGATFTTPMDRAGTFAYLCQIHPSMAGEVIVR